MSVSDELMQEMRDLIDQIHKHLDDIEYEVASILTHGDAEQFRLALGEVDGLSLRVYGFRKAMLQHARTTARSLRTELQMRDEKGGDEHA